MSPFAEVELICIGCRKAPHEISEYVDAAREDDVSPARYVATEEGTLNPENGHFACTECYVAMGMPSSPSGWVAP